MGRDSPPTYMQSAGMPTEGHTNSMARSPRDLFYLSHGNFIPPSVPSMSNASSHGAHIWSPLGMPPASFPSGLHASGPDPKQQWNSALLSAYMLHFWPGGPPPESLRGTSPIKSPPVSSPSPLMQPQNAFHQAMHDHPHHAAGLMQHPTLEFLRQKAQQHAIRAEPHTPDAITSRRSPN